MKGDRMVHYLIHDAKDDVGVAVVDIKAGERVKGRTLDNHQDSEVVALKDVPLGHKIALRDFSVGDTVTKYGQDIGKVVAAIKKGDHVHVHNIKTKRW
jgi:(2R)-sulfolactate sulfo-lyase subunit alpha